MWLLSGSLSSSNWLLDASCEALLLHSHELYVETPVQLLLSQLGSDIFHQLNSVSFLVPSGQSTKVFENMAEDFMRPVIDIVDQLLAANVSVTVYNGQLDLIVDTMGKRLFDWGWEQNR